MTHTPNEAFLFIEDDGALSGLAHELADQPWLCVDTEFMRETTYYPRLCLIQVASPEHIACIDAVSVDSLDPLLDVLYRTDITKILHAAYQDMELLFQLRGDVPRPVFDTQIAAALLSHNDQVGYGQLVHDTLGVRLEKGETRSDWCARPLSDAQLRYAADDVRYLPSLYHHQIKSLRELGREHWLDEDFARLADPRQYAVDPDQAWRRIKDGRRLKGQQLAVLQALAAWREQQAMAQDRPRRWVLRDEVVADIARRMPGSMEALKRIRGMKPELAERLGEELLQAVERGRSRPKTAWPQIEARPRLSSEQDALVDTLMAGLRLCAAQFNLSPAMLANRRELEAIALGDREAPVLHGWRAEVAGNRLRALLDGHVGLRVHNGVLSYEEG